jgi:hypothetical protein
MSKDTEKYIMNVVGTRAKNIIYIFKPRVVGKNGRKNIEGRLKNLKNCF